MGSSSRVVEVRQRTDAVVGSSAGWCPAPPLCGLPSAGVEEASSERERQREAYKFGRRTLREVLEELRAGADVSQQPSAAEGVAKEAQRFYAVMKGYTVLIESLICNVDAAAGDGVHANVLRRYVRFTESLAFERGMLTSVISLPERVFTNLPERVAAEFASCAARNLRLYLVLDQLLPSLPRTLHRAQIASCLDLEPKLLTVLALLRDKGAPGGSAQPAMRTSVKGAHRSGVANGGDKGKTGGGSADGGGASDSAGAAASPHPESLVKLRAQLPAEACWILFTRHVDACRGACLLLAADTRNAKTRPGTKRARRAWRVLRASLARPRARRNSGVSITSERGSFRLIEASAAGRGSNSSSSDAADQEAVDHAGEAVAQPAEGEAAAPRD